MGRVNIDELEPGMVLSAPVKNRDGQVMLGQGAVLTDRHLRLFKIWGVCDAQIEGGAGETPEQIESDLRLDPSRRSDNDEVDERFRYVQQDELMMQVKEEVKRYIHQMMGGGDGAF